MTHAGDGREILIYRFIHYCKIFLCTAGKDKNVFFSWPLAGVCMSVGPGRRRGRGSARCSGSSARRIMWGSPCPGRALAAGACAADATKSGGRPFQGGRGLGRPVPRHWAHAGAGLAFSRSGGSHGRLRSHAPRENWSDELRRLGLTERVAKLVQQHVNAKRLCGTNPEYFKAVGGVAYYSRLPGRAAHPEEQCVHCRSGLEGHSQVEDPGRGGKGARNGRLLWKAIKRCWCVIARGERDWHSHSPKTLTFAQNNIKTCVIHSVIAGKKRASACTFRRSVAYAADSLFSDFEFVFRNESPIRTETRRPAMARCSGLSLEPESARQKFGDAIATNGLETVLSWV